MKFIVTHFLFFIISNCVYADERFAHPNINIAHTEMQNRLEDSATLFNQSYIRSYVAGIITKKVKNLNRDDSDLILLDDDTQQTGGNNLVNSVIVEPGAEVEGDIFIIGSDNGDITLIDTD